MLSLASLASDRGRPPLYIATERPERFSELRADSRIERHGDRLRLRKCGDGVLPPFLRRGDAALVLGEEQRHVELLEQRFDRFRVAYDVLVGRLCDGHW